MEPQLQARQWPPMSVALLSTIKQGAIDGQGVARPHRTRLANLSLCQPHRQTEHQRCTGAPGPPVAPLGRVDYRTSLLSNRRPPAPAFYSSTINQRFQFQLRLECSSRRLFLVQFASKEPPRLREFIASAHHNEEANESGTEESPEWKMFTKLMLRGKGMKGLLRPSH
jgi:hypothetical protein